MFSRLKSVMLFHTISSSTYLLFLLPLQLLLIEHTSAVDITFDYFSNRNAVSQQQPQYLSNQTAIECPLSRCPISTVCNLKSNRCECASAHLVAVSPYMGCLTRKYLGESCITSAQCAHIAHSICVSNGRNRAELAIMPPKSIEIVSSVSASTMRARMKHPEKYLARNEYGRCECRPGHWPNQNQQCVLAKRLDTVDCTESRHCPDENSRCDFFRRKCVCEYGHKYDVAHDRCLLNVDMFGVFCKEHLDCQLRHEQMHCLVGICTCINNNRYDPFRGCGHVQPCKAGQTWNDFSKNCEPTVYNYNQQHRELDELSSTSSTGAGNGRMGYHRRWTHMSAEVWFKCFIFVIFIIGMTFTLKNRKTCFTTPPTALTANGGTNGNSNGTAPPFTSVSGHHRSISSDGNHRGYRINRFSSGVEQQFLPPRLPMTIGRGGLHSNMNVRVNLTEYDDLNESGALMVTLPGSNGFPAGRRWSLGSNSSLPPYEATEYSSGQVSQRNSSTAAASLINGPPPSYDQLPTYDEAIKEIETDSCAKADDQNEGDQLNKESTPTTNASANGELISLQQQTLATPSTTSSTHTNSLSNNNNSSEPRVEFHK